MGLLYLLPPHEPFSYISTILVAVPRSVLGDSGGGEPSFLILPQQCLIHYHFIPSKNTLDLEYSNKFLRNEYA
jgi:hypothetical protein